MSNRSNDRSSLCAFSFADGRQCRMPRRRGHPYLCAFHARREAQALAGEAAGQDIAYHLSGHYLTACDLSSALGRLFSAVAQGHMKPKTAATLAYLGQTLVQTLPLAQAEYIQAFGTSSWRDTVATSFEQSAHDEPADDEPAADDMPSPPSPPPQTTTALALVPPASKKSDPAAASEPRQGTTAPASSAPQKNSA